MDQHQTDDWRNIGKFLNGTEANKDDELFRNLARAAITEFSDVSDYIWKTPNFIEREIAVETRKLDAYFPLTGDAKKDELATSLRALRWEDESNKLFVLFPNLLAVGNLFSCLALFEAYCLRLATLIGQRSSLSPNEETGRGIQKIFKFFSRSGVVHCELDYFLQMNAALQIRNCLIHAEGLLSWDKNEASLRRVIGKGLFLSDFHRNRFKKLDSPITEVAILASDIGDKIKISNEYSHLVTTYARGYLISAATKAHDIYIKGFGRR